MSQQVLIIGFGDIAHRLVQQLDADTAQIMALVRRNERAQELEALGLQMHLADLDDPSSLAGLEVNEVEIYYFAPPSSIDEQDHRMRNFLAAIEGQQPRRFVYISTSGVYGNSQGAWVDETTPAQPSTERGKRRLDAEQVLQAYGHRHGVPVAILRVGGIYGPGRLPLRQLESARPVLTDEESGYTNRIHADDLAMICRVAMERGEGIYNVSDGHPGTMAQYFTELARELGYPIPERITLDEAREVLPPAMLSYLEESRRLDTSRLVNELGIELRYPDLKSGIESIKQHLVASG
ncbi:MAG: SDR family oxidoreductase [Gammaproteobacteria bacterium]|nr:SDR family oxidoreductase [Gammaproteobacteria bacterium]